MAGYIGSKAVSVNTTSATISDDLSVGDDLTVTDDATIGGTLGVTGVLTTTAAAVFNGGFTSNGDTVTFTSANSTDPVLILKNTTNDAAASRLHFVKDRGAAGTDGSDIGEIDFIGDNDAQQQTLFGRIEGLISDASDGSEGGRIRMLVASHDGEMTTGFEVKDGSAEDEIDVNIGNGTSSLTSVAGNIHVTGNASEFNGYANSQDAPIGVKSNSSHFAISLEENSGTETWQIGVDAAGDLNFHNSTSATPSVSINDDGYVGINTNTTTAPLTIKAPSNAEAIHIMGRSDDIGQIIFFEADGTNLARVDARNNVFNLQSMAAIPVTLGTSSTARVTVETNGNLTIEDGNLVVGTAGHGIDFSAQTQSTSQTNEELLNHYEQGTFSPTITAGGNGPTSYAVQNGFFTRIGAMVHVHGYIQINGLASMSGAIKLAGLPFAAVNVTNNYSSASIGYAAGLNITAGHSLGGITEPNATTIAIKIYDDAGGTTDLLPAELSADGQFIFTCSYHAV